MNFRSAEVTKAFCTRRARSDRGFFVFFFDASFRLALVARGFLLLAEVFFAAGVTALAGASAVDGAELG